MLLALALAHADCTERTLYYKDTDGDGYGLARVAWERCHHPAGYAGWATRAFDCDDTSADVHPGRMEVCDGRDDDCDGVVDGPPAVGAQQWYQDADNDGFGTDRRSIRACSRPEGFVGNSADCSDRDPRVKPGATELCNGIDDDCSNGIDGADAADAQTFFGDADGDGYGDATVAEVACEADAGFVASADDCDDTSAEIHPGATESCDSVDDDCDGDIDEADAVDASEWYADADNDGYGAAAPSVIVCDPPLGYTGNTGDCDDDDAGISPSAEERCDGADNDCDGDVDPASSVDASAWYVDGDGDGYGLPSSVEVGCSPPADAVTTGGDCDDTDDAVHEGCVPTTTYQIAWGDLHGHSGLSHDGCEDPFNNCLPEGGGAPGQHIFEHAAATGLAFLAMTDHAEYARYTQPAAALDLDIWAEQQAAVLAAEGGSVIPILGYEYTAPFGHRTVILDNDEACADLRKATVGNPTGGKYVLGLEEYSLNPSSAYTTSAEFEAGMDAAAATPDCADTRWLSWFHHPAISPPVSVDWSRAGTRIASDSVVEIASEHGSSECSDLTVDGCDFRVDTGKYRPGASVQAAIGLGYALGFVGGGDNHQGLGSQTTTSGGGYVGELMDTDGDLVGDTPREQFSAGAVTGVYYEGTLTKALIFDAIEARHTLASTWLFTDLVLHAYDSAGNVYLPGDDVPAGGFTVDVQLADPSVESWFAELVDPLTGAADPSPSFTLGVGDIRYIRIRAFVGGVEQRVWASPFFGV